MMYDPVELAVSEAGKVSRGIERKYYRFRGARFYGGIATADCLGCCLRCIYCWAWERVNHPEGKGEFCSPERVACKLLGIASKRSFQRIRISGNEPTLAREHLLAVLRKIPKDFLFILETNGILLGADPEYARELAGFPNLHVRVSLKAATPKVFTKLTGADPCAFELPLAGLENLKRAGVSCHASVMTSFSTQEEIEGLRKRLAKISGALRRIEEEIVEEFGPVMERLKNRGILPA